MKMGKKSLYEAIQSLRNATHRDSEISPFVLGVLFKHLERVEGKDYLGRVVREEDNIELELDTILTEIEQAHPELSGIRHLHIKSVEKLRVFWLELDRYLNEVTDLSIFIDDLIEELSSIGSRTSDLFPTPPSINNLALQLINPGSGSFHDSMCGLGGSLLSAYKHAVMKEEALQLSGQDINPINVAITKVRLFIEGVKDATIKFGDIISSPQFVENGRLEKFDYIFIDPPFGLSWRPEGDQYERFVFGTPPSSKMELAVLTHALVSLKDKGRAAVIMSGGVLYAGGASARIRQNIIDLDYVEAVITFPSNLYQNTALQTHLIMLNKDKDLERRNEILFINGEELYQEIGKRKRAISEKGMQKIIETYRSWKVESGFSKIVRNSELNESNLLPSQYIFSNQLTIEPFGDIEVAMDKIEEMNTAPLGDFVKLFRGYNVSPNDEDTEGQYKVVKASDIQEGQLNYENVTRYNIQKKFNLEDYRLKKGDLLITVRGRSIKVAHVDVEDEHLLFSQNFLGIRCGELIAPQYLKLYLESPVAQFILTSKLSGTTIPVLNRKDLEQLPFLAIPLEEQKRIAQRTEERHAELRSEIKRVQNEMMQNKKQSYEDMGLADLFSIKKQSLRRY